MRWERPSEDDRSRFPRSRKPTARLPYAAMSLPPAGRAPGYPGGMQTPRSTRAVSAAEWATASAHGYASQRTHFGGHHRYPSSPTQERMPPLAARMGSPIGPRSATNVKLRPLGDAPAYHHASAVVSGPAASKGSGVSYNIFGAPAPAELATTCSVSPPALRPAPPTSPPRLRKREKEGDATEATHAKSTLTTLTRCPNHAGTRSVAPVAPFERALTPGRQSIRHHNHVSHPNGFVDSAFFSPRATFTTQIGRPVFGSENPSFNSVAGATLITPPFCGSPLTRLIRGLLILCALLAGQRPRPQTHRGSTSAALPSRLGRFRRDPGGDGGDSSAAAQFTSNRDFWVSGRPVFWSAG